MIVHSELPSSLPTPSPADASSPVRAAGEVPAFEAGDAVHIGGGTIEWKVRELWTAGDGTALATLCNGWNSTTVNVDRLVAS
jgi:hypothetical protein